MNRIISIFLLILGCVACQTTGQDKVLSELDIQLEDLEISVPMDAVTPVEFTVSGTDGAEITAEVLFQDTEWSGEGYVDAETGEGLLYISAPDKVSTATALITVKDEANEREASIYISVSSTMAGIGNISLAFTQEAYEIDAGDTLAVGFRVSGLGNASLVEPMAKDITSDLTVVSIDFDPVGATGTVAVCASETAEGGEVTVTMKVKDSFNRTSQASAVVTVIARPAPVVPEGPVTPGSSVVPEEKSYNCYMVKPGGYARFTKKIAEIVKLELAWQDAPDIIHNMSISPSDGYVTVLTNATAGNALVLGKDASGNTLWSWHIWVVDFDPEETAVTVDGVTFMDRNLGAVSAAENDINAVGHTYQWGRKDPLPRATSFATGYAECAIYDINGNSLTPYSGANASGGQYYKFIPEASSGQTVTKADAVANAEYFFCRNEYNVAWWSGIEPDESKDLWGGVSLTKSEYDPCPQGWKVPVVSADNKHPFGFVTSDAAVVDDGQKGLRYTTSDNKTLWFPYTGERTRSEGLIARTARGGNYWTGTFDSLFEKTVSGKKQVHELYKFMQFKANGTKYLTDYKRQEYVASGLAVRCVKE